MDLDRHVFCFGWTGSTAINEEGEGARSTELNDNSRVVNKSSARVPIHHLETWRTNDTKFFS